jgi:hypothetical protein
MNFPSSWELVRLYNGFLLSGPLILCASAGFWIKLFRSFRNRAKQHPPRRATLASAGVLTLLIGSAHFLGIYASVANAWRFRFDPGEVAELRITRLLDETGAAAEEPPRVITDRAVILQGMSTLSASRAHWRNHEHFLDGYQIEIVIPKAAGSRKSFVSVFRRSNRRGDLAVVIPHLGVSHQGTVNNAGEYSCPAFHEWVARKIDPLFDH